MTKFKKVLFSFFAAYLLAVLSLAQAQNTSGAEGPSQKRHSGPWTQEIYSQLHLTDTEKKQLEANKQQHRAIMESARREIKADKKTLKEELMKPKLDMPKINAVHDQIKGIAKSNGR